MVQLYYVFQKMIDKVFNNVDMVKSYLVDLIIPSSDWADLLSRVRLV